MFFQRLEALCEERGLKITPLIKQLGMSASGIDRWRGGALPNGETLLKFADYFDVTTDYLLTGKKTNFKNERGYEEMEKELNKLDRDMIAFLFKNRFIKEDLIFSALEKSDIACRQRFNSLTEKGYIAKCVNTYDQDRNLLVDCYDVTSTGLLALADYDALESEKREQAKLIAEELYKLQQGDVKLGKEKSLSGEGAGSIKEMYGYKDSESSDEKN